MTWFENGFFIIFFSSLFCHYCFHFYYLTHCLFRGFFSKFNALFARLMKNLIDQMGLRRARVQAISTYRKHTENQSAENRNLEVCSDLVVFWVLHLMIRLFLCRVNLSSSRFLFALNLLLRCALQLQDKRKISVRRVLQKKELKR